MKVVYYRRADGSIRAFHGAGEIPEYYLSKQVKEYNNNSKTDQAFVTDLPEGSLEAHLFQQAQARARLDLDNLRDLRATLAEVDSLICDLICQAEEGR